MNQAEVLCHSSGPWKKHKYFKKIGEGANAVYKYAKDAATSAKIDADYYGMKAGEKIEDAAKAAKEKADNLAFDAEYYTEKGAKNVYNAVGGKERDAWKRAEEDYNKQNDSNRVSKEFDKEMLNKTQLSQRGDLAEKQRKWQNYDDAQLRYKKDTARGKQYTYSKTPLGKAESSIKRGQAIIDRILNPPVKKTVTDTKTGKTRTPSAPKSKADTVTLKRR